MPAILQAESTLNDNDETTVPESVRQALRLSKCDRIRYTIRPDGEVMLSRAPAGGLRAVDAGLAHRIKNLVGMTDGNRRN